MQESSENEQILLSNIKLYQNFIVKAFFKKKVEVGSITFFKVTFFFLSETDNLQSFFLSVDELFVFISALFVMISVTVWVNKCVELE